MVALDRPPGAGGHGALHHQGVLAARRHLGDDRLDPREVGVARVGGRRVDAAEQEPRGLQDLGDLGREVEAVAVALDQLGQAGLVDRDLAAAERVDLLGVDVDRVDLVAQLGEAGRGDETHPAHSDYAYRFSLGHFAPWCFPSAPGRERLHGLGHGDHLLLGERCRSACWRPSRRPPWSSSRRPGAGCPRRRAGTRGRRPCGSRSGSRGSARGPISCPSRRSTRGRRSSTASRGRACTSG